MLADLVRNEPLNASNRGVAVVTPRFAESADAEGGATPIETDFVVAGRVTDVVETDGSREDRYTQILFEVINANTHQVVLSDMHNFKKAADARRQWKYAY